MAQAGLLETILPLRRGGLRSRKVAGHRIYLGSGEPVLVLPEYGGGPETTSRLRHRLREAGFAPHDWGLGADNGPEHGLSRLLRQVEERVIDVFESDAMGVTLVGLGLSGVYAREVAKRTSPLVRRVITIGSPVRTVDPSGQCFMLRALFEPRAGVDCVTAMRLRQRPPVPCTSIYTVTDEAVRWDLAEDTESFTSENVAVPAHRHADLALHPLTLETITHRLAQPDPERSTHG